MKFSCIKYFANHLFVGILFIFLGCKKEINIKENFSPVRIVGEISNLSGIKVINGLNGDLLIFGNNANNSKLRLIRVDKNFNVLSDTILGQGYQIDEYRTSWSKHIYDNDSNIVIGAKLLSDYKDPNNVAGGGFSLVYKFNRSGKLLNSAILPDKSQSYLYHISAIRCNSDGTYNVHCINNIRTDFSVFYKLDKNLKIISEFSESVNHFKISSNDNGPDGYFYLNDNEFIQINVKRYTNSDHFDITTFDAQSGKIKNKDSINFRDIIPVTDKWFDGFSFYPPQFINNKIVIHYRHSLYIDLGASPKGNYFLILNPNLSKYAHFYAGKINDFYSKLPFCITGDGNLLFLQNPNLLVKSTLEGFIVSKIILNEPNFLIKNGTFPDVIETSDGNLLLYKFVYNGFIQTNLALLKIDKNGVILE